MGAMELVKSTPDVAIIEAYQKTGTIEGVGKVLGCSVKAKCVRDYIKAVVKDQLKVRAIRGAYTIEDVTAAVQQAQCMSDVLRLLGLSTHGSNAEVIKRLMNEHNICGDHFDVKTAKLRNKQVWSKDDVFVEHSPIPRPTLCRHVKKFGVLGSPKCVECGLTDSYNGKPINLTIDHINGVSDDNRVTNLRWLCPNCHSQTPTYTGKNKK